MPNSEVSLIIKMLSLIGLVPALKLVGKFFYWVMPQGRKAGDKEMKKESVLLVIIILLIVVILRLI